MVSIGAQVLAIGELATKVMGYEEGKVGEIIQAFRNTAYLRTIYDDLICITSHKTRGPMNINVMNIDFGGINLHDPIYKESDTLRIHDSVMSTRHVPIYRASRQFVSTEGLQERVLSAADIISSLAIRGSIPDSESIFFDRFSESIRSIAHASAKEDVVSLRDSMCGLVGLGNGATPSGDDFLAGLLFCLRTITSRKNTRKLTFNTELETSWHSRKFIEYAQDGFVIEPMESFAKSVLSGPKEALSDSIAGVLKIGHSSGIDAALGILFATTFGKGTEYSGMLLRKFSFGH